MERFVGVTLVVLGVYVLIALARRRDGFRMRSRFMLLHAGFRNARNWLRRSRLVPAPAHAHAHTHGPVLATSDEPYAPRTAFGIGMVHGIGAETPTQVLIFLTAAGAGGKPLGVFILVCFLAGLIASNTLVAVAGTLGFLSAERNTTVYVAVSAVTALFSLVIGSILLFGSATMLPSLLGG
jgi:high-affinity nickel-transport protein